MVCITFVANRNEMNWTPQYNPENVVLYNEMYKGVSDRCLWVIASPEIKHHVQISEYMEQYLSDELRGVPVEKHPQIIHQIMVDLALFPYPVEILE